MSLQEVSDRLEDICPLRSVDDMTFLELYRDTRIAFQIIGFSDDVEQIVEDVYLHDDIPLLWEFIFEVYKKAVNTNEL